MPDRTALLVELNGNERITVNGYSRVRLCGKPLVVDHRGPFGGRGHSKGVRFTIQGDWYVAIGWLSPETEVIVHG